MTNPHRRTMRARPVVKAEDAAPLPDFVPRVQLTAEDRARIRAARDKRARSKLHSDQAGSSYRPRFKRT